jgi:hypothetical protein
MCPQVIECGPPNASIHKIDEHIALADIEPLKNIYRRTLENLNASQHDTSAHRHRTEPPLTGNSALPALQGDTVGALVPRRALLASAGVFWPRHHQRL